MTVDLSGVSIPVVDQIVAVAVIPQEPAVAETQKSESVVASEVVEPTVEDEAATKEARRALAQKQFEQAIKDAERSLIDANLAEEYAKEELKASKANRIECLQYLQKVRAKGVEEFLRKLEEQDCKLKSLESSFGPIVNADENKATSSQVDDPASKVETDDSWKLIPTDAILSGVDGLGKKKVETIVEQFGTLGALEAARERASIEHKHFAEMFPKGIGQKAADQIEERMLDAISRYVQQPNPPSSQPNPPSHQSKPPSSQPLQEISESQPDKTSEDPPDRPVELDPDL